MELPCSFVVLLGCFFAELRECSFVELLPECSFVELLSECSFVELKGCLSAELLECSCVKLLECSFVELLTVAPGQLGFCIASEVNRFNNKPTKMTFRKALRQTLAQRDKCSFFFLFFLLLCLDLSA